MAEDSDTTGGNAERKRRRESVVETLRKSPPQRSVLLEANGAASSKQACPVCMEMVASCDINQHLDECLAMVESKEAEKANLRSAVDILKESSTRLDDVVSTRKENLTYMMHFEKWKPTFAPKERDDQRSNGRNNAKVVSVDNAKKDERDQASRPRPNAPYYLRAFQIVFDFLVETHDHLLTNSDWRIHSAINNLERGPKKLLVRLFNRKHKWLRSSNLSYHDIEGGIENALDQLGSVGLIECLVQEECGQTEYEVVLSSLRTEEVKRIAQPYVRKAKSISKSIAVATILDRLEDHVSRTIAGTTVGESMASQVLKAAGRVIRIKNAALQLVEKAHVVFFTPDDIHSPALLLADLGKVSFPAYICSMSRPVFQSSEAYELYADAKKLEASLEEALFASDWELSAEIGEEAERRLKSSLGIESSDKEVDPDYQVKSANDEDGDDQLRHPFLRCLTYQWILAGIAWHSVAAQERLRDYTGAVRRLRLILQSGLIPKRRGKLLNRLTIDLKEHLDAGSEALELCLTALRLDEEWIIQRGERLQLAKRAKRIWQSLHKDQAMPKEVGQLINADSAVWMKIPQRTIVGRPLDEYRNKGSGSVFIGYDGETVTVEELCIQSYRAESNWNGVHCEGGERHNRLPNLKVCGCRSSKSGVVRTTFYLLRFYRESSVPPANVGRALLQRPGCL
uniref:Fanconi-associated nuclease n=1 Tax=Rhodosorus marinus TaxID=101924 RepID=A0A7S3EKS7_9RHOD|mmetsp:Transcript_4417/g.18791  ORF Transcript_4417/g.18791 Transcript_4417/m.18791 type:complete len:683 (+) Transcript_4417:2802-4850(+)